MSTASAARLSALDRVLDGQPADETLAEELFAVADALASQASLRRALTDPGTPDDTRGELARALFGSRVGPAATAVVAEAARLRWTGSGMAEALERQGARALLLVAERSGQLDEVEDQLFKVERLVAAHPELRGTLADRRTGLDARGGLLGELLAGKVLPVTAALARRAVAARQRTFGLTVEGYLKAAAELRERAVATVTSARPLDAGQVDRLRAALTRQVGREVNVRVVVDPAVLGGLRVTLGDEVIEGTVAGRFHDARRQLA